MNDTIVLESETRYSSFKDGLDHSYDMAITAYYKRWTNGSSKIPRLRGHPEVWEEPGYICTDFDRTKDSRTNLRKFLKDKSANLHELVYDHGEFNIYGAVASLPSNEENTSDVDTYLVSITSPSNGAIKWPPTWIQIDSLELLMLHSLTGNNVSCKIEDPLELNIVPSHIINKDPILRVTNILNQRSFSRKFECKISGIDEVQTMDFLDIKEFFVNFYVKTKKNEKFVFAGKTIENAELLRVPYINYMPKPGAPIIWKDDQPLIEAFPLPDDLKTDNEEENQRRSICLQKLIDSGEEVQHQENPPKNKPKRVTRRK